MGKRLVIDLNKCAACEKCEVKCSYFYRPKATDHGVLTLRELANFAIFCRRCEHASCVSACKFEALERQPDGLLKRYNLRCVSCKCCSQACPFGTILPDTVPFYITNCDFCVGRQGEAPPCVISCVNKAIEYREVEESVKEGVFIVNDWLAVRSPKWEKSNV
ncbi:MAG: 4Fe-4S ferredoxin [Kiritimatiellae bacterium]|nr:4Fe-4S ferredoxin [Kiritimatiellia bacterium]